MGFVLALIACRGRAALADFTDEALQDPGLREFHGKVKMAFDAAVDSAYPQRWLGRVTVITRDGRTLEKRIASPKGDPDNPLTRAELENKALRLAAYNEGATTLEMMAIAARIWRLHEEPNVRDFLSRP